MKEFETYFEGQTYCLIGGTQSYAYPSSKQRFKLVNENQGRKALHRYVQTYVLRSIL
jgi:hypothetical protein